MSCSIACGFKRLSSLARCLYLSTYVCTACSEASLSRSARAARALIPDDDDEELIEKAKANRKKRLASEKEIETEFKKSGGFAEGEVRHALNRLLL